MKCIARVDRHGTRAVAARPGGERTCDAPAGRALPLSTVQRTRPVGTLFAPRGDVACSRYARTQRLPCGAASGERTREAARGRALLDPSIVRARGGLWVGGGGGLIGALTRVSGARTAAFGGALLAAVSALWRSLAAAAAAPPACRNPGRGPMVSHGVSRTWTIALSTRPPPKRKASSRWLSRPPPPVAPARSRITHEGSLPRRFSSLGLEPEPSRVSWPPCRVSQRGESTYSCGTTTYLTRSTVTP